MKIEIRKDCKICGSELLLRFRTFCSTCCRNKSYVGRYNEYRNAWGRSRRGVYSEDKLKCAICGKWYVQVGSHIVQSHGITAREYREKFDLPVKRGVVPNYFRKAKGDIAKSNKTVENLKKGAGFRFFKGDVRAKTQSFWKSRRYVSDEFYN